MKYHKLVRDKIPEYIKKRGGTPLTHIAGQREYWQKLKEKLSEEVVEFLASETMEELADIQEVLEAIRVHQKFSAAKLAAVRTKKARERGRFKKKIILEQA
ncbi:MAG: nucleoside triphosphate pyrophosphohydrolase [Patescibacteria group bacterium]